MPATSSLILVMWEHEIQGFPTNFFKKNTDSLFFETIDFPNKIICLKKYFWFFKNISSKYIFVRKINGFKKRWICVFLKKFVGIHVTTWPKSVTCYWLAPVTPAPNTEVTVTVTVVTPAPTTESTPVGPTPKPTPVKPVVHRSKWDYLWEKKTLRGFNL